MISYTLSVQKLTFFLLCWGAFTSVSAQALQVTGANTAPFTPQNLISNIFLGDGVEVTQITYAGQPAAVGYFTGGNNAIGIERGIVMTTGAAETTNLITGSNSNGINFASFDNGSAAFDADLQAQTTATLRNVALYTIKFIPTADTLRFRYCFGSEEYPEYGCSSFNDVFGFFIQGPGYPTFTNIARIPNTTLPVTINNLHPQNPVNPSCTPLNAQYYNDNNGSSQQPTYDGFTDVFEALAVVTPCQEYTIKLAIADVSDQIFDSGVFLEAKSFGTGSLRVEVATVSADGTVTEGCSQGSITFKLPNAATQNFPIDYNVWGTAINSTDYQTIPDNLFIPAGQSELVIPIIAFEDNTAEGPEYIAIDVQRDPCNRDTVYIYMRDNALLPPSLRPDTTFCLGAPPLELDGTLPIPLPTPPTFTNTQDVNIFPTNTPVSSTINVFGVQPTNLGPGVIRSVCMNVSHNWVDDLDVFLISPGGQFIELTTDNGGNGDNYTNTCFTPTATTPINFPGPFAPASAAPFTGDWQPEGVWSDLWDGTHPTNGPWRLQVRDDANGFNGVLNDWTITFEPSYKINYFWSPATGLSCPTCPITNASPTQPTTYVLRAVDSYGCEVMDSVTLDVQPALPAPTVTCAGQSANSVTFTWTNVPGNNGYQVNINGSGWVNPSGTNTHTVTGLAPSSVVTIEVRALNTLADCDGLIGAATCVNCAIPGLNSAVTPVTCFGGANGTVTIATDNLNPPYTFKLGNQTNSTGLFSNLVAGSYTATVTDNSGCSAEIPLTIDGPPAIAFAASMQQPASCFGGSNGILTTTISGGSAPFTYKWNDAAAQSGPTATNLAAGAYRVTVTDANGCTSTATATVTQPTDLILNAATTEPTCSGAATGAIQASGAGGVQPYTYAWSGAGVVPGQNNQLALEAGNYSVTITDANGCTESASITLDEPAPLTVVISGGIVSCFDASDGVANVNVQGGTPGYTYLWSDPAGQTGATATGLQALSYSVTVTDANGCQTVQFVNIASPPPLTAAVSVTNVSCRNGANGIATVAAFGGTGNYAYKWSDPAGQTGASANGLTAGSYSVTVTDANGCTAVASSVITEPEALQISGTPDDAGCFGANTGSIATATQGGTPPYQYAWNTSDITPNIAGKPAGAYQVTVTDAQGCTATWQGNIGQPSALAAQGSSIAVLCHGGQNGALNITASGGTGPYSVAWTGPNNFTGAGVSLSNLFAGNYTAVVTDAAGCVLVQTLTVGQPAAPLSLTLPAVSDTICSGASDGVATVTAAGGTPPYNYLWNAGGQTGATASGLPASTVQVTVTDANACTQSATTQIVQKGVVSITAEATDPLCHNGQDGNARITAANYGATPTSIGGFTYVWSTSPAQTGAQINGLSANQTYTVTATDAQGCSATYSVSLGNPPLLEARIDSSGNIRCHGNTTGWAVAGGTGGTPPYTYFWGPGVTPATNADARNLRAGTYRVTITDANGCPAIAPVTLTEPDKLAVELVPKAVGCYGENTGTASALASGGVPPYAYSWTNGSTANAANNLAAGFVGITLRDQNGCILLDSVLIRQPEAPLSGTAQAQDVSCFGDRDGRITLAAAGGTPPYRYALDDEPWNGSTIQIALTAGEYVPQIIDHNGCTITLQPVTVAQPDPIAVDLGPDIYIDLGQNTQLQSLVSNAQNPVLYTWRPDGSRWLSCLDCPNPLVDSLYQTFRFVLEVEDIRGCKAEDDIRVIVEKPRRIFVPTAFSPNGDGANDRLLVHGQSSARVLEFRLYDRWGELLYQANDFNVNDDTIGWDGTFRDKAMDPGVYVWVLEVQYLDGEKEVFKGNTTLVR